VGEVAGTNHRDALARRPPGQRPGVAVLAASAGETRVAVQVRVKHVARYCHAGGGLDPVRALSAPARRPQPFRADSTAPVPTPRPVRAPGAPGPRPALRGPPQACACHCGRRPARGRVRVIWVRPAVWGGVDPASRREAGVQSAGGMGHNARRDSDGPNSTGKGGPACGIWRH